MKKILTIALLSIFYLTSCKSIPEPEPMDIPTKQMILDNSELKSEDYFLYFHGSTFWGSHYTQGDNDTKYSDSKIFPILEKSNEDILNYHRKAEGTHAISLILAGLSGGLLGYSAADLIINRDLNTKNGILLGSGFVSGIVSYLISLSTDKSLEDATTTYNNYLDTELFIR